MSQYLSNKHAIENVFNNFFPVDQKLLTRGEQKQVPPDRELFTENDLNNLPELNPPDIMPNGNVGTPTMVFLEYIKNCRLPPKVIKKLGLTFPKTKSKKQFGCVFFDYGGEIMSGTESDTDTLEARTASGHELVSEKVIHLCNDDNEESSQHSEASSCSNIDTESKNRKGKKKSWRDAEAKRRMEFGIEEKMIGKGDESGEVRQHF